MIDEPYREAGEPFYEALTALSVAITNLARYAGPVIAAPLSEHVSRVATAYLEAVRAIASMKDQEQADSEA